MKIISARQGFASDHSSTSYEFFAVDKPLGKKERSEVSRLSSRANPSPRRVSFIYHADGYDIPGGWEILMEKYYDVMYSESYDWWTLVIAFNGKHGQYEDLNAYEFTGVDDLGVEISRVGQRIIVMINCRIEMGMSYSDSDDYYDYEEEEEEEEGEGEEEEEEEGEEEGEGEDGVRGGKSSSNEGKIVETNDALLNILGKVRGQIIGGDYRALYAVWEKYGYEDEDDDDDYVQPPKPKAKKTGENIVNIFANMLEVI